MTEIQDFEPQPSQAEQEYDDMRGTVIFGFNVLPFLQRAIKILQQILQKS